MTLIPEDSVWVGATQEGESFSVSESMLRSVLTRAGRQFPVDGEPVVYGGVVFTRQKRVDRPFRYEATG